MLLVRARLAGIGPFEDATITFGDPESRPRPCTVVVGGAGSGKTSLLSAIASTRPGHAIAQLAHRTDVAPPGFVVTEWHLGDDDKTRPHALRVTSPNAKLDEPDDLALIRRREQTLYDRRASERGFVFVAFSGARWFSRAPSAISSPDRSILRYDVRAAAHFDDASRADLARETKQVLTYAAAGSALATRLPIRDAAAESAHSRLRRLDLAVIGAVLAALEGTGIAYDGIDPVRFEPVFSTRGSTILFDDLPRSIRHVLAFVSLTLRALAGAYPDIDPRGAEGVAAIDDAESQLPISEQRTLVLRLKRALPNVQWIVGTASPAVAEGAELSDVVALRRSPGSGKIEIFDGAEAVLH
ncbi:MAG: hypothetical protein IPK82_40470 [Polyangiaceae bacterium]|nr:hypothetical protein [Polyangiaceae bacterium]